MKWVWILVRHVQPSYPMWRSKAERVRVEMESIIQTWAELEIEISQMDKAPEYLEQCVRQMQSVVDVLEAKIAALWDAQETARMEYEGWLFFLSSGLTELLIFYSRPTKEV